MASTFVINQQCGSGTDDTTDELEVIPDPVCLMESMRAVGYSIESALADLIDNSVSAGATEVRIRYSASSEPFVAILDNGDGMGHAELTNAMRHGSRNPSEDRDRADLGRFGLGLKTASLSQARTLTVISKKDGAISARCWDIDHVNHTGKWLVLVPSVEALSDEPFIRELKEQDSGTLVIWRNLDRMLGEVDGDTPEDRITKVMSGVMDHLALVFHRFIAPENRETRVNMYLNGMPVPARDPFLQKHEFCQKLEGQPIRHERGSIMVQPFVLPPMYRLSPEEVELAGGSEGLRGTQGFYVYREKRLVIWGTWFRIVPKKEVFKLTRVQVDIPNTFDDLWALDIKKSSAVPSEQILRKLRALIPHFSGVSRKVIQYKGRVQNQVDYQPFWNRVSPEHGKFSYEVNADHPLVVRCSELIPEDCRPHLSQILEMLASALPMESIYADMCEDTRSNSGKVSLNELVTMARQLLSIWDMTPAELLSIEPFVKYTEMHKQLLETLNDG